jgi:hypothetical protein
MEDGWHSLRSNGEPAPPHDKPRHIVQHRLFSPQSHVGLGNMPNAKNFDATPAPGEWEAGLEASLRSCRQIVSEYRAMLTAACRENPPAEPKAKAG